MNASKPVLYNPLVAELLGGERLNELGPGTPDRAIFARLSELSSEQLVAPHKVRNRAMAEACLAGLWLRHDFLDQSHEISQSLDTVEGSYWHGIMHRREPDYENAKYWFRRVGAHPIHEALAREASALVATVPLDPSAGFLRKESEWDAFRFVDLCQAVASGLSTSGELCRRIQRLEWSLLFDYCWGKAAATD